MNLDLFLRAFTLIILTLNRTYWFITKPKADRAKPKTKKQPIVWELAAIISGGVLIFFTLLGLRIFPFDNIYLQIVGFVLVLIGFIEGIWARYLLSDNWAESYNFQIKKDHELITAGIYKYLRHPIYSGFYFLAVGSLLVSSSWLFLPIAVLLFPAMSKCGQREELILIKHFGEKYRLYMQNSKRLIPFIY